MNTKRNAKKPSPMKGTKSISFLATTVTPSGSRLPITNTSSWLAWLMTQMRARRPAKRSAPLRTTTRTPITANAPRANARAKGGNQRSTPTRRVHKDSRVITLKPTASKAHAAARPHPARHEGSRSMAAACPLRKPSPKGTPVDTPPTPS